MQLEGKKIAVIGAGFAGVSLSYILSQKGHRVTLFDPLGVGGLSSQLPVVLCHPYPSRMCIRSMYATQALQVAHRYIRISQKHINKPVADFTGLDRMNCTPRVMHEDIEKIEGGVRINSGYLLFVKQYLCGLYLASKGVELKRCMIHNLCELGAFDKIVLCTGASLSGLSSILEPFKLDRIKGQMILCSVNKPIVKRACMNTLHEIPWGSNLILGSTYERNYSSIKANMKEALASLKQRKSDYPFDKIVPLKCFSSARLSRKSPQYLPVCEKISSKIFVFTALGSRGALYHALFAQKMAALLDEKVLV